MCFMLSVVHLNKPARFLYINHCCDNWLKNELYIPKWKSLFCSKIHVKGAEFFICCLNSVLLFLTLKIMKCIIKSKWLKIILASSKRKWPIDFWVEEINVPYLENVSMTTPPPTPGCSTNPTETAASTLENRIGLSPDLLEKNCWMKNNLLTYSFS